MLSQSPVWRKPWDRRRIALAKEGRICFTEARGQHTSRFVNEVTAFNCMRDALSFARPSQAMSRRDVDFDFDLSVRVWHESILACFQRMIDAKCTCPRSWYNHPCSLLVCLFT